MARQDGEWGYSARIENTGLAPPQLLDWGSPPQRGRPPRKPAPDAKPKEPEQDKKPDDEKAGSKKDDGEKDNGEQSKPPMPRRKKLLYWAVGLLVLAALVTAGVLYWLNARHYETTDDAFIDGYISQISSQVAGRVTRIAFEDNQQVKAGQMLD